MAEKCTNTSSPPGWEMKPKPFASLNHFTVPLATLMLLESGPEGPNYRDITLRLRPVTVTAVLDWPDRGSQKKPPESLWRSECIPRTSMVNRRQRQYRR